MHERALPDIVPGSLKAWLLACRPATLTAALVPVFVGSACAAFADRIVWDTALAALVGAILLQIGSNFANDVFDHDKGADTAERLGPTRAVQTGLLTRDAMLRGMLVVFGLALAVGIYLTWRAGPTVIVIGLASIVAAVAYTGGPYPLGYRGLGDLFVILFFGFVAVAGTAFVQLGYVPGISWWCGLAVGALASNILVVNNVRDEQTDRGAGKRTLVVRFGRAFAETQYAASLAVAYAVPASLVVAGIWSWTALLPWLTLPLASKNFRDLRTGRGRALNSVLVGSARFLFIHGCLLAIGILLAS